MVDQREKILELELLRNNQPNKDFAREDEGNFFLAFKLRGKHRYTKDTLNRFLKTEKQ